MFSPDYYKPRLFLRPAKYKDNIFHEVRKSESPKIQKSENPKIRTSERPKYGLSP